MNRNLAIPGAGAAASFLTGLALDAVKQEFEREAKSYEHQYTSRLLLNTKDLGDEGLIVVTRWIDDPVTKRAGTKTTKSGSTAGLHVYPSSTDRPDANELVSQFEKQSVLSNGNPEGTLQEMLESETLPLGELTTDSIKGPAGKRPAAVLTFRVKREDKAPVYRIAGARLWASAVGAKVVHFGWGNLPKIWQWPGALLLKSDSQVEIEAMVNIKSLMQAEKTGYQWTEIKPETGILSSTKVNLSELPKTYNLGNNVGAWLAVPAIKTDGGELGFVIMDFKLNERDTSNASKYLEQAAGAVDKNRSSILDAVSKAVQ